MSISRKYFHTITEKTILYFGINYFLKKKYREKYSLIISANIVVWFFTLREQYYTHIWELGITTTVWYKMRYNTWEIEEFI